MRLPEVADALREIADNKKCPKKIACKLTELAGQIARRRPIKRGPNVSARMTPALAKQIRSHVRQHPNQTQIEVAKLFNVNPGRVSEVTRGKRK